MTLTVFSYNRPKQQKKIGQLGGISIRYIEDLFSSPDDQVKAEAAFQVLWNRNFIICLSKLEVVLCRWWFYARLSLILTWKMYQREASLYSSTCWVIMKTMSLLLLVCKDIRLIILFNSVTQYFFNPTAVFIRSLSRNRCSSKNILAYVKSCFSQRSNTQFTQTNYLIYGQFVIGLNRHDF